MLSEPIGIDSCHAASRGGCIAVLVWRVAAIGNRARSGCARAVAAHLLPRPRRSPLHHDGYRREHRAGVSPGIPSTWLPLQSRFSSRSFRIRRRRIAPRLQPCVGGCALSPAKSLGLFFGGCFQQRHSSRTTLLKSFCAVQRLGRPNLHRASICTAPPAVGPHLESAQFRVHP
jgi:hypothetical protein